MGVGKEHQEYLTNLLSKRKQILIWCRVCFWTMAVVGVGCFIGGLVGGGIGALIISGIVITLSSLGVGWIIEVTVGNSVKGIKHQLAGIYDMAAAHEINRNEEDDDEQNSYTPKRETSHVDDLSTLIEQYKSGHLTKTEFEKAKKKILDNE